jgi:hypothetical protein
MPQRTGKKNLTAARAPVREARAPKKKAAPPPYMPDGFVAALKKKGAKKLDPKKLLAALEKAGVAPEPGVGAYLDAKVTANRYGIQLPTELRALFAVADELAIEDVKLPSYRYLRAAPQGWEIPGPAPGEPLLTTFMRRFEWNAFSNMQLWEHFAGVVCIGWGGRGDDRVYAAMHERDGAAPVFIMDHETASLDGCVARSVSNYLRTQLDPKTAAVPAAERSLILEPEHRNKYLPPEGALRLWPPFLERRSRWIVAALAFGDAKEVAAQLKLVEPRCFDAAAELPDVSKNVPLAMYWLFRTFLLGESDLFEAAHEGASLNPSPLVRSTAQIVKARWGSADASSRLVQMRSAMKDLSPPRKAVWARSGWSPEEL